MLTTFCAIPAVLGSTVRRARTGLSVFATFAFHLLFAMVLKRRLPPSLTIVASGGLFAIHLAVVANEGSRSRSFSPATRVESAALRRHHRSTSSDVADFRCRSRAICISRAAPELGLAQPGSRGVLQPVPVLAAQPFLPMHRVGAWSIKSWPISVSSALAWSPTRPSTAAAAGCLPHCRHTLLAYVFILLRLRSTASGAHSLESTPRWRPTSYRNRDASPFQHSIRAVAVGDRQCRRGCHRSALNMSVASPCHQLWRSADDAEFLDACPITAGRNKDLSGAGVAISASPDEVEGLPRPAFASSARTCSGTPPKRSAASTTGVPD